MTISASTTPLLLLPIPAVLIFFRVRLRRRAEHELLLLQNPPWVVTVGERVATRGGLHLTVTVLTPSTVTLDVCDGLTHCCNRNAVVQPLAAD